MNGKTTLEIPADDRRPVMEYVSRSSTKIVNHSFFVLCIWHWIGKNV